MTIGGIDGRWHEVADLHAALDASGVVGTWDWDPVSHRVRYDRGAAALLAGDAALAGRDLGFAEAMAGIHPDDRPWLTAEVGRAMRTGGLVLAEYRAGILTGRPRWVLSRGRVFQDQHGRAVRSTGILIDITEGRTADAGYVVGAPISEEPASLEAPLLRAADLCIALRTVLDGDGSSVLNALVDRLLLQFGCEIARSEGEGALD